MAMLKKYLLNSLATSAGSVIVPLLMINSEVSFFCTLFLPNGSLIIGHLFLKGNAAYSKKNYYG